jgi:hypothetical protein
MGVLVCRRRSWAAFLSLMNGLDAKDYSFDGIGGTLTTEE